jgi:hypothetical protein
MVSNVVDVCSQKSLKGKTTPRASVQKRNIESRICGVQNDGNLMSFAGP